MHRLASLDVSARFTSPTAKLGAEALFGLGCALAMIGLRGVVDIFAPTSGPFAMVYPTVLIATLFGHWRGGLVAYLVSFFYAWGFVLHPTGGFTFTAPSDASRVAINAVSAAVVMILAETFRRAVRHTAMARDAEIERRGMLLDELEHRTKNNFALVASLLELQRRRSGDPAVADALQQATRRVHTFARAYANLAHSQGEGSSVEMAHYLDEVVGRLIDGAFDDSVTIATRIQPCVLPRQVAVAIGLFVNEALTNCAKYAFHEGQPGRVDVEFACDGKSWSLTVTDDGMGAMASGPAGMGKGTGMGSGLMQAFARQAMAESREVPREHGHCVRLASI